jgi:lysophospholipase L1-like esterase
MIPRILKLSAANLAVLLLIFLVLEVGARIITYCHWVSFHPDNKSFRLTQPPPYQGADYFSKEFVEESFRHLSGWAPSPASPILSPKDFSGKYFHVKDGVRRTTGQPADRNLPEILVFGGSSIYGAEVPDDLTVASQLQQMLNQANLPFRVINYGVQGVKVSQEFDRLRTLNLKEGDIVIFFDGVNDIVQGVFRGDPDGYLTKPSLLLRMIVKASSYSYLVNLLWNDFNEIMPAHLADPGKIRQLAEVTTQKYQDTIVKVAEYSQQHGYVFVHFVQPNLYTLKGHRHSGYENQLQSIGQPGVGIALMAGDKLLGRVSRQLSNAGILSIDAMDIFDNLDEPVYLDYCHVNHKGNKIMAELIFKTLTQKGVLSPR